MELTVTNAEVANYVLSPRSPCIRPKLLGGEHGMESLAFTGDLSRHSARRKAWSPHSGSVAMRTYESRILAHVSLLTDELARTNGQAVDGPAWFKRWAFDVMSDLTFNSSFNMVCTGEENEIIGIIEGLTRRCVHFMSMQLLFYITSAALVFKLRRWCNRMLNACEKA